MTYPSWFDHTTWGSKRWKTAIRRTVPSVPIRLALERGVISKYQTTLDFGSGQGFDSSYLSQLGFPCNAFDPYYHFAPSNICPTPVIACNFVLNVIEREQEQAEVLRYLWNLTERSLILSVRTTYKKHRGEHLGDNWTSIGTFQRFYTQTEWVAYIAKTLGVVRVEYPASGIAFIHK